MQQVIDYAANAAFAAAGIAALAVVYSAASIGLDAWDALRAKRRALRQMRRS